MARRNGRTSGTDASRTRYGGEKYAAFLLLISRWLRVFANPCIYRYVTLGGTELRDVQTLFLVDPTLVTAPISYEEQIARCRMAQDAAALLKPRGLEVEVIHDSFFTFNRSADDPHIFFFDIEGIFAWGDYHERLGDMFVDRTIRDGDVLFVTSHLGHNPGWPRVFETFDGEFRQLRVGDAVRKRELYRSAHPAFTIYKALEYVSMTSDLLIDCIGSVAYRGSSPMGVYGYAVKDGKTRFTNFIAESQARFVAFSDPILI